MRAVPDTDDIDLQSLPRFQRASRQAALLLKLLIGCGTLVVIMIWLLWRNSLPSWQPVLVTHLAMLLVLAASLQSVWWLTRWRARALLAVQSQTSMASVTLMPGAAAQAASLPHATSRFVHWRNQLAVRSVAIRQFIQDRISVDAAAAIGMGLLSLLALLLIIRYWNRPAPDINAADVRTVLVAAGGLLLAFALLVLERFCAGSRARELPEAVQIAYLLRVSITMTLLVCACVLLSNESRQWPARMLIWIGLLPAALAVELLLRAILSVFTPPQQHEPELLAESLLAGMWRWPLQPFKHLHHELKQRFGIDLRQSWAFAYIRRATLPVLSAIGLIAWLLTGVSEIPIDGRGIYERLGKPVAVWAPGLHVGLPWPFARVRAVENGVVHELATASAVEATDAGRDTSSAAEVATAEGLPPASANRLWDASHVAEKSQVIASLSTAAAGNRQSFHIVNMDVRFMYRIGLNDAAALAATYNSNDLPQLIRSTASRILVSYFASRTLDGVLGERRTQLAIDIGTQLQMDLNALDSGVEILATVIEAIHPPAAAANAYHSVQAAQIGAQAIIARERGNAAEQLNLAQTRAGMARDKAAGAARETVATAEAAQLRFAAERNAYRSAGKAFLLEQYLGQLSVGLANAQLVIVDHRLRAGAAPTIDLRSFAAPIDATVRRTE